VPNIKSVKKDVIRSRQRNLRNRSAKSALKTFVKKTTAAIAAGDAEALAPILSQTVSVIDKTAKRGIIHKNAAARRKSRLMKRAAALTAAAA
jgi:small subunit ribosomal protein S20